MKMKLLIGTWIMALGIFVMTGEAATLSENQVNESLMRIHFQNQEQVWEHVQKQQKVKQVQDKAFKTALDKAAQNLAAKQEAEKVAGQSKRRVWLWIILMGGLIGLILAYLFWKRIQYRFQEYHELKGEAEKTYEIVQQNHQWHKYNSAGLQHLDQDEYEAAIETFDEALAYSSADHEKAETYHYMGIAYWHLYSHDKVSHIDALFKASQYLDEVEKFDPGNKELILDNNSWLIEVYRHLKQLQKAILVTEKSIVLARELNQDLKIRKLEHTLVHLEAELSLEKEGSPLDQIPQFDEPTLENEEKFKTLYPNQSEVFS